MAMARIILDPSESFEHAHTGVSFTEVIEGKVMYIAEGSQRELVVGERVEVPAGNSHRLVNFGDAPATLVCYTCR